MPQRGKRKLLLNTEKANCNAGNVYNHLTNTCAGQAFKAEMAVKVCMNKKESKLISEIYLDCLLLKKRKEITEFGEGQLKICEMLLGVSR